MPVAWPGDGVRSDPDILGGGRNTTRAVSGYWRPLRAREGTSLPFDR